MKNMSPSQRKAYIEIQNKKKKRAETYNQRLEEATLRGFAAWAKSLPIDKMNEWYDEHNDLINQAIASMPDGHTLQIGGHTNARGSSTKNRSLSKERARQVLKFLLKRDIKKESLTYYGYGARQAGAGGIDPNDDRNKKITFRIVLIDQTTIFEKLSPIEIFRPAPDEKLEGGWFESPL